tara:strand:- start:2598 stop:2801 length:204 start_codon:yes stop_codon:yes gene_type:complete
MKNEYLKETFSNDKVIVSKVDIDAMHRYISSKDSETISAIVYDALTSMDIKHDGFGWDINVTVEQEK